VFGPVIRRVLYFLPISNVRGTTLSFSIKGCLPSTIESCSLAFISGIVQLFSIAYLDFPFKKSSSKTPSPIFLISSTFILIWSVILKRIFLISSLSLASSSLILLLRETIERGSINTVCPLEDLSCSIPFIRPLKSNFTGITLLPSRIVTIFS